MECTKGEFDGDCIFQLKLRKDSDHEIMESVDISAYMEPPKISPTEDVKIIDGEMIIGGKYPIDLHRIDNPTKIVWWIHHLVGKGWFTRTSIRRFIEVSTEYIGLGMYEGKG